MQLKLFAKILTVGLIALGAVATISPINQAQTNTYTYFCGTSSDGVPTTYARTVTGRKIAIIRWEKNWGGEYTPKVRCQTVSAKFQQAYEDGFLNYLTSGIKNGQKVVCAVRRYGESCGRDLLTLRPEEDPDEVIRILIAAGSRASGPIVQSEDGSPQYYYDMNLFLREAPTEPENQAIR
jgi:Circadian oscillating protein COP23